MKFLTPQVRLYLYGVSSAAVPLLVTLGIFSQDLAKDILFLVAAVFGVGSNVLAAANVKQPAKVEPSVSSQNTVSLFVEGPQA